MKSRSGVNIEPEPASPRRQPKQELGNGIKSRVSNRTNSGKRSGNQAASSSPGPSKAGSTTTPSASGTPRTGSSGAGRTPQTKRRELTLNHGEKNSPSGSPRPREVNGKPHLAASTSAPGSSTASPHTRKPTQTRPKTEPEDSSRKSSNSSQDSGIGRETKSSRQDRIKARTTKNNPIIRTISPDTVEVEVPFRKKFEELCDVKNVELGIVKVPPELLEDLIHKGDIENYYDIEAVPVASGLFATVRKCTNKETGVEYAAKFSSRVRCGVDCTTEVLHEIALLSICAESSNIVHLKDVFQNKHEVVLVLEYAPGGDFQSVLDDDMVPFEQDVQGFIMQLLEALSYIHQRKIAHLDIKPQNIVLMSEFPNCEIKLCDLEVSRVIQENEQIRQIIGTPDYVAPEILGMEPITLAADIWSLGVLAYVLLTGFSPFGGDSDQETLRNIASAPLDFPAELFEGVSDEAKDFIRQCLHRAPPKRPTVQECFQHPWISQNAEPPSPSPLMLKIPAPDHYGSTLDTSSSGGSRRSCQTCRDKITERKRYLSKSREAIFEKVTNSNLKKSLSKSRERLCDMRLTLSKSRDYLNESKIASRSQEKFYGFKSLSKSQEVLSEALGGNMKRMVNGAVSDISPAHLPINPRVYLDTPDACDFVILPGSSVLMSHTDLMTLSRNSDSLQILSLSESGRSTPANPNNPQIQFQESQTDHNSNATSHSRSSLCNTLTDVKEEVDEYENRETTPVMQPQINKVTETTNNQRRRSSHEVTGRICTPKEAKNNINYETKQSMSRSASMDGLQNNNSTKGVSNNNNNKAVARSETAEVAVQVDLSKFASSPETERKGRPENSVENLANDVKSSYSADPLVAGNMRHGNPDRRLRRGFSHDDTLGEENKRHSWREELDRFRATKKPLAVSDLIDTFTNRTSTRKVSSEDPSFPSPDTLKAQRRGSLQIQINAKELASLTAKAERDNTAVKLQRRKSTSAILPLRVTEVKMPEIAEDVIIKEVVETEKRDHEKVIVEKKEDEDPLEKEIEVEKEKERESEKDEAIITGLDEERDNHQTPNKGLVYLEKVNERKRTWDYFEINHPKAISDKKLEQLKNKYTRRKTETSLLKDRKIVDSNKNSVKLKKDVPPTVRTHSVPVISVATAGLDRKSLDLAFDPLTGESIGGLETESVDSGKGGDWTREPSISSTDEAVKKAPLTSSCPEPLTTVDGSEEPKKKEGLKKIVDLEQEEEIIPSEKVLECFIDPFTGQFITNQVSREESKGEEKVNLKVKVGRDEGQDDGIGSLPDTPTDLCKPRPLAIRGPPDGIDDGISSMTGEVVFPTDSTDSDQLSTVSTEDWSEGGSQGPAVGEDGKNDVNRESVKAVKVCTGSFSRGIQRFRSQSPVLPIARKADP